MYNICGAYQLYAASERLPEELTRLLIDIYIYASYGSEITVNKIYILI